MIGSSLQIFNSAAIYSSRLFTLLVRFVTTWTAVHKHVLVMRGTILFRAITVREEGT